MVEGGRRRRKKRRRKDPNVHMRHVRLRSCRLYIKTYERSKIRKNNSQSRDLITFEARTTSSFHSGGKFENGHFENASANNIYIDMYYNDGNILISHLSSLIDDSEGKAENSAGLFRF